MNTAAFSVLRMILNGGAILGLNIAAGLIFCHLAQHNRSPARWETSASLFFIGEREHHDTVFLGGSRAYSFTSCHSAARRVETSLSRPFLSLAGPGNGSLPVRNYVEHFYDRGNSARQFIYFVDTPLLYADRYNEGMLRLNEEPIRLRFLMTCARNGVPLRRLVEHFRAKFSWEWLFPTPMQNYCSYRMPDQELNNLSERTKRANISLYPDGVHPKRLDRSLGHLELVLQAAESEGTRVIVVILPTMLLHEPGKRTLVARLTKLLEKRDVPFYDFAGEMASPEFFYDMHHMNEAGAVHFATNYLAPILNKAASSAARTEEGFSAYPETFNRSLRVHGR